jgi:hypothetical protein
MTKLRLLLAVLIMPLMLLPSQARAGKIGGTLARYVLGGAGIGAALGAAAATVPYLNDHQSFDFSVGAGGGAVAGAVGGLIFGIIDLATEQEKDTALMRQQREHLFAFRYGQSDYLGWKTTF